MTKFGTGRVTEVLSQQSVQVNRTLCHVKDVRPFWGSHPSDDKGDTEDSEQPIYLRLGSVSDPSNIGSSPTNPNMLSESSPEEEEIQTIPLRRRTQTKDHICTVICVIWKSGEGDGQELECDNEDSNDLPYRRHKIARLWCAEF